MTELIQVANFLLLLSFLSRDVLWLRVLNVAGLSVLVGLDLYTPGTSRAMLGWNVAFAVLNAGQAALLLWERRPARMSDDEAAIRWLVFDGLTDLQFLRLARAGHWHDAAPGSGLVRAGVAPRQVMLLCTGDAMAIAGGREIARLGPGDFVGEIAFLTGELPAAGVVVTTPARVLAWDASALDRLLDDDPTLRAAIHGILGLDVALKLRAAS